MECNGIRGSSVATDQGIGHKRPVGRSRITLRFIRATVRSRIALRCIRATVRSRIALRFIRATVRSQIALRCIRATVYSPNLPSSPLPAQSGGNMPCCT